MLKHNVKFPANHLIKGNGLKLPKTRNLGVFSHICLKLVKWVHSTQYGKIKQNFEKLHILYRYIYILLRNTKFHTEHTIYENDLKVRTHC